MKRLISNIKRYLLAVDREHSANNDCNDKLEAKAIDKQFDEMEKLLENYTKTAIRKACTGHEEPRIKSFYNMYIK